MKTNPRAFYKKYILKNKIYMIIAIMLFLAIIACIFFLAAYTSQAFVCSI